MGGRGGGALAARTAIDRFLAIAPGTEHVDLRDAVVTINDEVVREAVNWGFEHVGTTLLAALIGGPLVTVVHVGDSRAYRSSGAHLDLLTDDHNVRGELLAAGLDIAEYRDRGVALHGLTSFIGLEHEVPRIDVLAVPVRAGDRLLLCTDGVHRQLDDDQLRRGVAAGSCHDAAEQLVEHADEAGGRDNATAMVHRSRGRLTVPATATLAITPGTRTARPADRRPCSSRRSAMRTSSTRSARPTPARRCAPSPRRWSRAGFEVGPFACVSWTGDVRVMVFGDVAIETDQPSLPMLSGAGSRTWVEHSLQLTGPASLSVAGGDADEFTDLAAGIVLGGGFRLDLAERACTSAGAAATAVDAGRRAPVQADATAAVPPRPAGRRGSTTRTSRCRHRRPPR